VRLVGMASLVGMPPLVSIDVPRHVCFPCLFAATPNTHAHTHAPRALCTHGHWHGYMHAWMLDVAVMGVAAMLPVLQACKDVMLPCFASMPVMLSYVYLGA